MLCLFTEEVTKDYFSTTAVSATKAHTACNLALFSDKVNANRDELLFIEYMFSSRRLLVDSGAQSSVLPATAADALVGSHGPPLDVANRTPIQTFCTRFVTVCFNGYQFDSDFVMASVTTAIIGTDFFFVCPQPVGGHC